LEWPDLAVRRVHPAGDPIVKPIVLALTVGVLAGILRHNYLPTERHDDDERQHRPGGFTDQYLRPSLRRGMELLG
jgi:hypothetical protein